MGDVRDFNYSSFDAIWASPPCQERSSARTQGDPLGNFCTNLLEWALALPSNILWVENVTVQGDDNKWGKVWNAAQFLKEPIQNRNRIIGGRYSDPIIFHSYRKGFPGICPCVTASEDRGCATDKRRASRFYKRKLTIDECAYHQGLEIPQSWREIPPGYTKAGWNKNLYQAIGNGVPVYMAQAFGKVY